jgi:hypothetical protein
LCLASFSISGQKIVIKDQILEAIKQMPNSDRLEVIEFALKLLRQDIDKPEKLSLRESAEIMRPFYAKNSSLTEFVDKS